MQTTKRLNAIILGISILAAIGLFPGGATANESLDELYKKALKEEGVVNCYCSLAQINAQKIFPVFEKRFPGIRINHVDATSDKLAVRAITEARGGRVIADVFEFGLENITQLYEQKLLLEKPIPEAAAYPDNLKGPWWTANNLIFFVGAWNTDRVKKEEAPDSFDDFADPRWKGRLIAEPRDVEILIGLMHKHNSLEKAIGILKKIAANKPEFHKGHSELAEFLVAGQAAACFTCYSHHYPPRIKKGAPLGYFLTEGVGGIIAVAISKDAPHPNSALLYARWAESKEGQQAFAKGGRTPAHPEVEPVEPVRPKKIYAVGVDDIKQFKKYEKIWKEIFNLR
ncbi:MAG TPA: ABC transporter substrate-binding protein [Candidatus Eisenbacteria bacterium]|nr:ABC transporter substrate-binding protein [Candidatus Eisenbacteria bacterium]